jgi:hypothetical protein
MKYLFLAFASLLCISVKAQLFEESFSTMAPGSPPSNGWTQCVTSYSPPLIGASNLSYPNYFPYDSSNCFQTVSPNNVTDFGEYCKGFTNPGSNVMYTSFLLRANPVNWTDTNGQYFFSIGNSNSDRAASVYFKRTPQNFFEIGIAKGNNTAKYTNNSYLLGNTYLVVIKYESFSGPNNDKVKLFINPVVGVGGEPACTINSNYNVPDFTSTIQNVHLRMNQTNGNVPAVQIDKIRVDTSWSGVINGASGIVCDAVASFVTTSAVTSSNGFFYTFTSTSTGNITHYKWSDGTPYCIPNNSNTLTTHYDQPGNYVVCLTAYLNDIPCSTYCEVILVGALSTASFPTYIQQIYTEPNAIVIQSNDAQQGNIILYTIDGKKIIQEKIALQQGKNKITIPSLAPGIYLAQWNDGKQNYSIKLNW